MLKSFQRRVSARKTKLIKGLCLSITVFFISLCTTPIQIYASGTTYPTLSFPNTTMQTEWYSLQFAVTNFQSNDNYNYSTGNSCELSFVSQQPLYGFIDAVLWIGSSALNYGYPITIYVADGVGSYKYTDVSNSPGYINRVEFDAFRLKKANEMDLTDIVTLLNAIKNNQLTANSFIEDLVNRYTVDIASIPIVLHSYYNLDLYDVSGNSFNNYPIFRATQGDNIAQFISRNQSSEDAYRELYFVCLMNNGWSLSNMNSNLVLDDGAITNLGRISTPKINGQTWQLVRMTLGNFSSTMHNPNNITYQGSSDLLIIPIYLNYTYASNYSTDFAQTYDLPNNTELQYLETIAQGTTESNSAATGLDNETSSFESVASGLYQSENSFNQNMNSSLQSIDTSFNPSTSFGSKFLYSADWVRSQFNTITSNTPFGSVLSFSMLLGLSLLIIGKVFK